MQNYEIEATWHYHNGTKHPNGMLLNRFHVYHPSYRPSPYKVYKNTPQVDLPLEKNSSGVSALEAISTIPSIKGEMIPNLNTLSRILYFSAGITKKIKFKELGEVDFRAASCTGALYHIEIYVICFGIAELEAGVYHFDPKGMKLDILRRGNFHKFILDSTANESFVRDAPIMLVFTDVFARNSVKYQSREYRHAFWDCGTILANTMAIASAHKIPSKIITGFVDLLVSQLLSLDMTKEAPLVIVPLGKSLQHQITPQISLSTVNLETVASEYEIDYPEINAMHDSSSLSNEDEVYSWRKQISKQPESHGKLIQLEKNLESIEPLEQVIIKRGSTRKFSLESITFSQLSTILNHTTSEINTDYTNQESTLSDLYLIVNAVEGLESGSYYYVQEKNSLELLRKGNFRHIAGNLGLDQDLSYDASITIFFMVDLAKILEQYGNRGYRISQLDSAIRGGKAYLTSYALNLGATGLTFYDDAVTNFFSPHAANKEAMFLIAIGKKEKPKLNQIST